MNHSLQMQIFQSADDFSDVESKTIKNENITIMRLFSIIRAEAIMNCGPFRRFILTLLNRKIDCFKYSYFSSYFMSKRLHI